VNSNILAAVNCDPSLLKFKRMIMSRLLKNLNFKFDKKEHLCLRNKLYLILE
jgi:hypothetical protein